MIIADPLFDWMRSKPKMIFGRISPNEWQRISELCNDAVGQNPGYDPDPEMIRLAMTAVVEQFNPGIHFGVGFSEGTRIAMATAVVGKMVEEHKSSGQTS
jgi:hypothetical protein